MLHDFIFIYLREGERQREREWEEKGEKRRKSQEDFVVSVKSNSELDLKTLRSGPELKPRV